MRQQQQAQGNHHLTVTTSLHGISPLVLRFMSAVGCLFAVYLSSIVPLSLAADDGTGDQEGDNTVCCTTLADDPPTPTDGMFTCTEDQYGYHGVNTTWSPDGYQMCIGSTDSLTGIAGRITPLCSECCPAP